jgi:hypothetical protein
MGTPLGTPRSVLPLTPAPAAAPGAAPRPAAAACGASAGARSAASSRSHAARSPGKGLPTANAQQGPLLADSCSSCADDQRQTCALGRVAACVRRGAGCG